MTAGQDLPASILLRRPAGSVTQTSGHDALDRLSRLSPREFDVLALLADGQTSKVVASNLGIGTKTVDMHRARVMDKMRCDSPVTLGRLWEAAVRLLAPRPEGSDD